jgi:hypothetical protein
MTKRVKSSRAGGRKSRSTAQRSCAAELRFLVALLAGLDAPIADEMEIFAICLAFACAWVDPGTC